MEALTCRLLPYAEADGPHNMAADEVLLESAVRGTASLRFYGWSEPTLSLGYFQRADDRLAEPRLTGLPLVRRLTGGGALVHHHELTYALALPPGPDWQNPREPVSAWLGRVHELIAEALRRLGVVTQAVVPGQEQGAGSFLCFQHLTPGDLILGPAKVVGSAQRRRHGVLLQHGAVLRETSPATPALPGIASAAGPRLTNPDLAGAVREVFHHQLGWVFVPSEYSPEDRTVLQRLVEAKYGREDWTRRR